MNEVGSRDKNEISPISILRPKESAAEKKLLHIGPLSSQARSAQCRCKASAYTPMSGYKYGPPVDIAQGFQDKGGGFRRRLRGIKVEREGIEVVSGERSEARSPPPPPSLGLYAGRRRRWKLIL